MEKSSRGECSGPLGFYMYMYMYMIHMYMYMIRG